MSDDHIVLRILWTTNNLCIPIVSMSVASEMDDAERIRILHACAEFITEKRKRQRDKVEETLGRNCEDHITVTCNAMFFPRAVNVGNMRPAPAFVKWLVKALPDSDIIPKRRLKLRVAWSDNRTRELHEQA